AALIVCVIFLRVPHDPVVQRMLHRAGHFYHDGLLHLRAGNDSLQFLPHAAIAHRWLGRCLRGSCRFLFHYAFLNSVSRSKVLIRAKSRLASRSFFKPSACPVESWNRRRKICSASSPWRVSSS